MIQLVRIEQLAEQLNLERRWIVENWLNCDDTGENSCGPAPHFRDGRQIFLPVKALEKWAEARAEEHLTKWQPQKAS